MFVCGHSKVSASFMLNFAKSSIKGISHFWRHVCFRPFQSFSTLDAEFYKIWHQGHLPFLKEIIVFGPSQVHPVHLSCSNNIRNSWLLLTEPNHSAAGDSRAHTLSVMIRGQRSRPLMMRRMTTGSSLQESSLQESCLLTGRDSREIEACFLSAPEEFRHLHLQFFLSIGGNWVGVAKSILADCWPKHGTLM
jgi:hypothetical protein